MGKANVCAVYVERFPVCSLCLGCILPALTPPTGFTHIPFVYNDSHFGCFFKHTEQQVSAILNPFKDGDTVPIKNDFKILG